MKNTENFDIKIHNDTVKKLEKFLEGLPFPYKMEAITDTIYKIFYGVVVDGDHFDTQTIEERFNSFLKHLRNDMMAHHTNYMAFRKLEEKAYKTAAAKTKH